MEIFSSVLHEKFLTTHFISYINYKKMFINYKFNLNISITFSTFIFNRNYMNFLKVQYNNIKKKTLQLHYFYSCINEF